LRWIDQWRLRRKRAKILHAFKSYTQAIIEEKKCLKFCTDFYERGLIQRAIRHMKLFS
jgi:hypothetical protein